MSKKININIPNGKLFANFLNKACMGDTGAIPEVLIEFRDGFATAHCTDVSGTRFSMCTVFIGEENDVEIEICVPEVSKIIKHLSTDNQYRLIVTDTLMAVTEKGKRGAIRARLIAINECSTALSATVTEEALELDKRIHIKLNCDSMTELHEYLVNTDCVCVIFTQERGRVYAMSPEIEKLGFKTVIGRSKEEFRSLVYAKPLTKMLDVLKEAPINIYILEDHPIVLEQEGNYWGIGEIKE